MHQCLAPCINKDIDYKNYRNEVASFLNGNAQEVIDSLKEKMNNASMDLQFELAAEYRDQIKSVEYTISKQKIAINDLTSRDYIAIYEDDDEISLNIIVTRLGNIISNHQSIFSKYDAKEEIVSSYLAQFYDQTTKPKEVAIIGIEIENLGDITGAETITPQIGRKKELLDMALYNAKFNLENRRNIYKNQVLKRNETIDRLGELLGIKTPEVIEAFDNSNLFGEYPVSGMVVYKHGRPSPNDFRKYHIKTVVGANDYESMKEVVYRRYYRLLMEDQKMPDLIIMDGGEIQVHAATDVISSLGLEIPILGIQKDDHHKATILYFNDKFIKIDKNDPIFILISDISQRVHDYAISFFRSQKAKGFFSSYLDGVKGLGEKRKEILIKKFVTIDAIKKASLCDIIGLGIPENVALNLIEHLNNKDNIEK
jgi:excinuclease ABC subunit C